MATLSTNVHDSSTRHFLEVEVNFEDLDKAYNEDEELNVSKDISGGDDLISRFSPTITLMHTCVDPNPGDFFPEPTDHFVLKFENTSYLKCHLHNFSIELGRFHENNFLVNEKFGIDEQSLATNVQSQDGMKLSFDINNDMLAHPLPRRIKALKGFLSINFEPDQAFFLNRALEQEFSLLRLPQEPEDFGIKCQNEEVKFNKKFLCKISDVFAVMIENPCTVESRQRFVSIEGVDIKVIKTFKRILCEQKAPVDDFNNCELLLFADRYNIQPLLKSCRSIVEEYMSSENILEVIKTADAMNDHILLKAAAEFVSAKKGSFDKDPEWMSMLQDNPQCFAKMMELVIFK